MARDTTFYLFKNVNLSPRTGDTFYFASRSAQTTYFGTKLYTTISTCSYQRENRNYIKVNLPISSVYNVDYIAFINQSYENKRFYAFVNEVNYISDTVSEIGYSIDYIQTWLLDCSFTPCFVERQHSTSDAIGDNTIAESLETGDYIIRSTDDNVDSVSMVVFQATFDILGWANSNFSTKPITTTIIKNGIVSALSEVGFYLNFGGQTASDLSALGVILEKIFTGAGGVTMDDIVNIYVYPKIGLSLYNDTVIPGTDSNLPLALQSGYVISNFQTSSGFGNLINLPTIPENGNNQKVIGNYVPKNNKIFTYPYTCLHVTNNNGSSIDLQYERFALPNSPTGYIYGTSTAEAKIRFVPNNYFGGGASDPCFEYALDSAPYPTVAQVSDSYNIWLAQNRNVVLNGYNVRRAKALFNTGGAAIGNIASAFGSMQKEGASESGVNSAAAIGMIQSGYNIVGNTMFEVSQLNAELSDKEIAPNTATGVQSVGLAFQNGKKNFSFYVKTLDDQHAVCIDNYWTMYGYPVRKVQTPNFHARSGFTYIKTVGAIAKGNVPENAKNIIQAALDSGLRFWASHNDIGDYSIANNILT